MLVDDEPDSRYLLEHNLRKVFPLCQVLAYPSAAAALAELERGARVDAIVTDNDLGELSGCDFIARVRSSGLTCPMVMVTCSGDPLVAQAAYQAGATKVFDISQAGKFAGFLKTVLAV